MIFLKHLSLSSRQFILLKIRFSHKAPLLALNAFFFYPHLNSHKSLFSPVLFLNFSSHASRQKGRKKQQNVLLVLLINVFKRHIDGVLRVPHEATRKSERSNFCNCVKVSYRNVMFHFSSLTMKNTHRNVI